MTMTKMNTIDMNKVDIGEEVDLSHLEYTPQQNLYYNKEEDTYTIIDKVDCVGLGLQALNEAWSEPPATASHLNKEELAKTIALHYNDELDIPAVYCKYEWILDEDEVATMLYLRRV